MFAISTHLEKLKIEAGSKVLQKFYCTKAAAYRKATSNFTQLAFHFLSAKTLFRSWTKHNVSLSKVNLT